MNPPAHSASFLPIFVKYYFLDKSLLDDLDVF